MPEVFGMWHQATPAIYGQTKLQQSEDDVCDCQKKREAINSGLAIGCFPDESSSLPERSINHTEGSFLEVINETV